MIHRSLPVLVLTPLLALACADEGSDAGGSADGLVDGDTGEDMDAGTEMGESGGDGDGDTLQGLPILGDTTHDIANLDVEVISSATDGLAFPTDLEFNPLVPGELWVTNRTDYSIVVYQDAGTPTQLAMKLQNGFDNGTHFLAKPAALAFGAPGTFATAQQENVATQPGDPPDGSFMGPTLWTSDLNIFTGGHQSHLDMLHNSPLASGIAWEADNTYWVYDGTHGSLTRYLFNQDHGLGGTDHTDGAIYRYADGELGYENSIASHVVFDHDTAYVYAADSQNGRIVRLDPTTATMGNTLSPNYDGCIMNYMSGAELITLVDGSALDPVLTTPSGLELVDGVLYVSDPINGRVYGFDTDGTLLDWLETGLPAGSLMGMAFDDEGSMWITDPGANQVRKFSVPG